MMMIMTISLFIIKMNRYTCRCFLLPKRNLGELWSNNKGWCGGDGGLLFACIACCSVFKSASIELNLFQQQQQQQKSVMIT